MKRCKIFFSSQILFLRTFGGHSDYICAIIPFAWKKNKSTVVTSSDDRMIKLWDLCSGMCIKTIRGHTDYVYHLVQMEWDYDETTLISGSRDTSIKVWNVENGKCLNTLLGHTADVYFLIQLKWTQNKSTVVSGSWDMSIRFWDIRSFTCFKILTPNEGKIYSLVQISLDDHHTHLVSCGNGIIKIWNVDEGICTASLQQNVIETYKMIKIVWKYDNFTIACSNDDKSIKFWSIKTEKCLKVIETTHTDHILTMLQIYKSDENNVLLSGSWDKTIRFWDLNSFSCIKILELNEAALRIIRSDFYSERYGKTIIIFGTLPGGLCTYDADSHVMVHNFIEEKIDNGGLLENDKQTVATFSKGTMCVIKIKKYIDNVLLPICLLKFKAKRLYLKKYVVMCIAQFCASEKRLQKQIALESKKIQLFTHIKWSKNNSTFAIVYEQETNINIINIDNEKLVTQILPEWEVIVGISHVKMKKDENSLLSAISTTIKYWNIETEECLFIYCFESGLIKSLFQIQSEMNDTYAICSDQSIAELNLTSSAIQVIEMTNICSCLIQLTSSSSGTCSVFAMGMKTGLIQIWDHKGDLFNLFEAYPCEVVALAESQGPALSVLLSVGEDITMKLWNINTNYTCTQVLQLENIFPDLIDVEAITQTKKGMVIAIYSNSNITIGQIIQYEK